MDSEKSNRYRFLVAHLSWPLSSAFVFAMFLGPDPELGLGVGAGVAAGAGWVATSYGINYLFAQRSLTLFFIDAGYHTLQFTLYGAILALL